MDEKVYIASSFNLKLRVIAIAGKLKKNGFNITREWWHTNYKVKNGMDDLSDDKWYEHDDVKWVAQENFNAIDEADIFLLIAPKKDDKKFNGANIEFGYAYAKGLDCYAIGNLERSGMYQPITLIDSIEELKRCIKNE